MNNINKNTNVLDSLPTILPKAYLKESISTLYEEGLPKGLYTSIGALDNVSRLDKGRLVTITGVPNYGKSEFVDFLTTTYNKRFGFKTLYFSPENQPLSLHIEKLVRKYSNKAFSKESLQKEELSDIVEHITNNFYFFNYERVVKLDDIITIGEETIKENQIDILVIDAYNKIESELPNGELETNFISKVLDRLCQFAIRNNVLVLLVAHPKKMEFDESKRAYKCPRAYDINGSANFYNKSDFVLTVHRDFSKEDVIIRVDKVKFSNYGKPGECRLKYDFTSGNYYEVEDSLAYHEDGEEYTPIPFNIPKADLSREALDVDVSIYSGATDNKGGSVNLKKFLFSEDYRDIAAEIRKGETPQERHEIKDRFKRQIPCVTIAGKFSQRDSSHLEYPSKLIGIDIDLKDNQQIISEVPNILRDLPYISYCGRSISGDGYFAICEIDNPKNFKAHFLAIEEDFKALGIIIDPSCKDMTRLRFATYDPQAYYNPFAEVYTKVFVEKPRTQSTYTFKSTPKFSSSSTEALDKTINELESVGGAVPDDYTTWYDLSMSLSTLGEEGRRYFHRLSSTSSKYDPRVCDKQFDSVLSHYSGNNSYTLGTAIKIIKDSIN